MTSLFKTFNYVREFMGMSGIPFVISRVTSYKKTIIISYHRPSPTQFESHVRWLIKHYVPVSLQQFLEPCVTNEPIRLPAYSVIITFDDGWRENIELLPIIIKYRLPVIFYLTAGLINTNRKFWWLQVLEKGDNPNKLKTLPHEELVFALKKKYDYEFEREYHQRCTLNWDEIHQLKKCGHVEFGSHSLTHPILPQCPDEILYKELFESKQLLEKNLDQSVIHFAYPNGDAGYREKKLLLSIGYKTGRNMKVGWNDVNSDVDLFELKTIYGADHAYSKNHLSYNLSGIDVLRKRITSYLAVE